MELTKLNEAYTLTDVTETWMTSGNVTKEMGGAINININTTLKEPVEDGVNRWGSLYYSISSEGNVSASYNFGGPYKESYVDYCEKLTAQILEQVAPTTAE